MLETVISVMTIYEWLRVLLALAQLVAMIGIPFVLHWLEKRTRNDK